MRARQTPMSTEFGYRSTAADVIAGYDLAGKTAIVTGGYCGLGLETVKALFAVALDARGESRGIHAFSVHPGGIMTELQRHVPSEELLERQWIDADAAQRLWDLSVEATGVDPLG